MPGFARVTHPAQGPRLLHLSIACTLVALAAGVAFAPGARAEPNVVMIVTDDQRTTGTMDIADPALDPMAKTKQWFEAGGTRFPQGSTSTPLCCPSRASIFTGRYVHNHNVKLITDAGVLGTTEAPTLPNGQPNPQRTTLQYYLQQQKGYRTGLFGKYLNGWDANCHTSAPPTPPPFFTKYALLNNSYSPSCVNEQGTEKWMWRYTTDYLAEKAEQFIQQAHDESPNQPWFLYVAPFAPHAPFTPAPQYAGAAVPTFAHSGSRFEADRSDKPTFYQSPFDMDLIAKQSSDQLRMLRSIDDLVEKVMQKVNAVGDGNNTIAFYTSDNGYMWGEHGVAAKSKPYLDAVKVPFYLRWPGWAGHAGGETDNRLVGSVDFAPTILDAVGGVTPSVPLDGQSLLDSADKRNRTLTEFWQAGGSSGKYLSFAAIRTPTFHYIEHYLVPNTALNPPRTCIPPSSCRRDAEYYNLIADPHEETNLLVDGDPKNNPPTGILSGQIDSDYDCPNGQSCPGPGEADVLAPDTAITSGPDPVSGRDVTFTFTKSEPAGGFACYLDNGAWNACNQTQTYTNLAPGPHSLSVMGIGPGLQFMDITPATWSWTVDDSIPDARLTGTPPDTTKTSNSRDPTFTWTSSNATAFECTLDTQSPSACTSPKSYSNLTDGNHTFTVKAISGSSGDQTPPTHTWKIDATPPTTALCPVNGPACIAEGATTHSPNATFWFRTEPAGDQNRFECQLDSGPWRWCYSDISPTGVSPVVYGKTYEGLGPGLHTFGVRAVDKANNTDPTPETRTWTVGSLQTFHTAPDTGWPTISSGTEVRAILPDNCGGWYVGGNFTHDTTHVNLLHIKKDKQVDAAWNPSTNGTGVRAMVLDQPNMAEPGRLYIGGSFTTVNNTVPRNNVAAITTPSFTNCLPDAGAGGVDPNWNPKADGAVFALAPGKQQLVPGSPPAPLETIYVGGAFTNFTDAGGTIRARSKVAALNLTDGTPTTWNPSAQPATSNVFALAVTATNVYVGGGGFTSIGGQSRTNLAEIDRSTATATSWAPNPNSRVDSLLMPQPFDPPPAWVSQGGDGPLARMYVGGQFTTIGSPPVARSKAAELNLADNGSATTWDPSLTGAAGQAFFPIADTEVIVGGAFHLVQGNLRSRLAETYAKTGVPYDWHPNMDKAVYALAHVSPVLAVGGLFTTVGPPIPPHPRLAFFCPVTGPQACSVP